ncbi:MAG: hypothetical protein QOH17_1112, partial [Pseudonocardiales bacterium]|nr:hypothetical protein [Pseudonocardiales bacterium]
MNTFSSERDRQVYLQALTNVP